MGEAGVGGDDNRRLLLMAGAVIVVSLVIILLFFRTCGTKDPYSGYTPVYSNLDLKDAANVVTQLKILKIPYQIRDEGRTVAVPKNRSDDARLGLAEKNLPTGGSVGWEIFDTAKLGTTDFDRRIQFIRAISGELSRTIKRIDAVFDARIQIVIPQTPLFEITKVPVTASVLLQLKPGRTLSKEQVNGIIRLVASSVENLRPENVIIVDIFGNILSGLEQMATAEVALVAPGVAYPPAPVPATAEVIEISKAPEIKHEIVAPVVPTREVQVVSKEVAIVQIDQKPIQTPEEKALSKLKAKEEFENRLSSKAQMLVNKFFPPNSILVKVNVDLEEYKFERPKTTKPPLKPAKRWHKKKTTLKTNPITKPVPKFGAITPENIRRMTIIVLIDNRFNLTPAIKKTTIETIKNVLSYHPARGDTIIIRQVPFHYATAVPTDIFQKTAQEAERGLWANIFNWFLIGNKIVFTLGILLLAAIVIIFARKIFGKKRKDEGFEFEKEGYARTPPFESRASAIDQIRASVAESPERVASLLKKWLTEE